MAVAKTVERDRVDSSGVGVAVGGVKPTPADALERGKSYTLRSGVPLSPEFNKGTLNGADIAAGKRMLSLPGMSEIKITGSRSAGSVLWYQVEVAQGHSFTARGHRGRGKLRGWLSSVLMEAAGVFPSAGTPAKPRPPVVPGFVGEPKGEPAGADVADADLAAEMEMIEQDERAEMDRHAVDEARSELEAGGDG